MRMHFFYLYYKKTTLQVYLLIICNDTLTSPESLQKLRMRTLSLVLNFFLHDYNLEREKGLGGPKGVGVEICLKSNR